MSSSTSALKASKSIVESYISSTERSDLTTTFTENTPISDISPKKNIIQTILGVVKHPKFKWILIAILLCICVFVYFKSQNKQTKQANKEQIEDSRLDITRDKDGRPILIDLKEKEYMDKITKLEIREKQLQEKLNQLNANKIINNPQVVSQQEAASQQAAARLAAQQEAAQRAAHQARLEAQQEAAQRAQQEAAQRAAHQAQLASQQRTQQNESDSSEEVFIENENVMNHNLTMEEMNAIDRQLEDINIDNMGFDSN
jgi:hypothetical protein